MSDDEQHNQPRIATTEALRLPGFWASNPNAWFIRIEAQFNTRKIRSDDTKYEYLLSALPEDVIVTVMDHIAEPPDQNKYNSLKEILIKRNSESEERRLEQVLSATNMGDRKPGEFYRYLETTSTAGGNSVIDKKLLQKLWLRKLPSGIRIAILSSNKVEISEQQDLADKIWDATQSNRSMCTLESNSEISLLRNEIESLRKQISAIGLNSASRCRENDRSPLRSRSRNRSRSNSKKNHDLCWYHYKFGEKAVKCNKDDCKFKKSDSKN